MNLRLSLVVFSYALMATSLGFLWVRRSVDPEPELFWHDEARREIQSLVENRYVDPLTDSDAEDLFDSAMEGYLAGLDPYSRYFPEDGRQELDEDTKGSFYGVGVSIRAVPEGLWIVAVRVDGPADAAGILPGETLTAVDGEALTGRDVDGMVGLIKGPEGTDVALTVRAADGAERTVGVVRGAVGIDTVPAAFLIPSPEPGGLPVAYLRLSGFSEQSGEEVRRALDEMAQGGAAALVLDLRDNLGGVVSSAVGVASLFLPPGSVVCRTWTRGPERVYETPSVTDPHAPTDLPLVVLVNESSASASELLAGALQDHGRAVLLGERTFGKFLVQTLFELDSLPGAVARITTARYVTPRGRSAQQDRQNGVRGGMIPDVVVRMETAQRDAMELAFARHLNPRTWRVAEGEEGVAAEPKDDPQLAAALALLRGGGPPAERVAARAP